MILICAALGLFLVPSVFPQIPYRWAPQLLGLACLSAVIYISVRYVGRALVYSIVEYEGERFFTVTEVNNGGRSRVTVCRIGLENIEAVYALDKRKSEDRAVADGIVKEAKRSRNTFVYHIDIMPNEFCYILADEGESLLIKIAVDQKLVEYLKKEVDSRSDG